jgi:hypothetical protein
MSILRPRPLAGALFLLTCVFAPPALACSCMYPGPPCQAYWNSPVVFAGTPLGGAEIEVDRDGGKVSQRLFRFRVDEAFRGVEGKEVEVLTGAWGGDCGYDFKPGTKYLVYGYAVKGKPWVGTGICSRTRPLSEADEDLGFIRGLRGAPPGGTIFGTARRYTVGLESRNWDEAGTVAGAKVVAESGGLRLEDVTDSEGRYGFEGLAPGKYTVRVEMPAHLSPQEVQTVEVHDRGCAQIDYAAVIDGRVSGKLLDAGGRSPGTVTVNLLPAGTADPFRALWDVTEADGSFEFKNLPPGRYLLGVNLGDAPDEEMPYRSTYYPSTTERGEAEVIELGEGQRVSGIQFRLPPPLARRAVTGVVVWSDGRPVSRPHSEVSVTEVSSGRPAGMNVKVGPDGRFTFQAFEGVLYKVRAQVPADPNWSPDSGRGVALLVSPETEVTPSAGSAPLRLVIQTERRP